MSDEQHEALRARVSALEPHQIEIWLSLAQPLINVLSDKSSEAEFLVEMEEYVRIAEAVIQAPWPPRHV